jgi:hypothetical protein
MSDDPQQPPYCQIYITAWTILSVLVATAIFLAFVFGQHILNTGHWIWDLIRYFARPII